MMKIFGKSLGDYICFAGGLYLFVIVIGILRFGLYQAGARVDHVRWVSMTYVMLIGIVYLGVRTYTSGFGGFRQLLPLTALLAIAGSWLAALGIMIAIYMQTDTIFSLPEFSGPGHPDGKTWTHALAHLFLAPAVGTVIGWGLSSLVMLVTRAVKPRPQAIAPVALVESPAVAAPVPAPASEPAPAVEQQGDGPVVH